MCLKNKSRLFKCIYLNSAFLLIFVIFNVTNSELYALTPSRSIGEYEIKAAFLYNFAKFIEWPEEQFSEHDGAFIIGIYGKDPFGPIIERTVKGKTINGRKVVIKRFKVLRKTKFCHIIFISRSKEKYLKKFLAITKRWSCLTVGDTNLFAKKGCIVGFTLENKKVRFSINIKAAKETGIKISSNLLKIANIVNGENYKEN